MLAPLTEFTYLTAPKSPRYRKIMQFFHEQHLLQHSLLPPEDILASLGSPGSIEDLLADLENLIGWGNLDKRRDLRRVSNLTEYARRKDLYFATPRGLAIEAFLEHGLDAFQEAVAVSAGVVSLLENRLTELAQMLENPDAETLERLWADIYRDFQALSFDARQLAANLERKLHLEELEDFLAFKDVVHSYVEKLARELAFSGRRVREALESVWTSYRILRLAGAVALVQAQRITTSATRVQAEQVQARTLQEFQALKAWFQRSAHDGDGLEYAIDALRLSINKVLSFIDAVYRTQELGLGRAGHLAELAKQVMQEESLDEARWLLSKQLNTFAALHLVGEVPAEPVMEVWQQPVDPIELTPIVRGRPTQNLQDGEVGRTSSEAKAAAQEARENHLTQQRTLQSLFDGGLLVLHGLNLSEVEVLHQLLSLLELSRQGHAFDPSGRPIEVTWTAEPAKISGPGWSLWMEKGAILKVQGTP